MTNEHYVRPLPSATGARVFAFSAALSLLSRASEKGKQQHAFLVAVAAIAIGYAAWSADFISLLAIPLSLVLACAGGWAGRLLSRKAALEIDRLRRTVAELQVAKAGLENTVDMLQAALKKGAATSKAKSTFLASLSHELRTPLNAVIGFSDIMSNELFGPLGSERYHNYLRNIKASGLHLLELINEVLDHSKLEAEQLDLNEEIVDLTALLCESLDIMTAAAEKTGHHIVLDIGLDLPVVLVDRRRMRQIMLNLLSNALKFSAEGSKIYLTASWHHDGIAISVSDSGIGMAREDIPKALESFGQVDTGIARRYEGTGLGLPVAKRLIELHGGSLEIESAVGVGTTVLVLIPASRAHLAAAVA